MAVLVFLVTDGCGSVVNSFQFLAVIAMDMNQFDHFCAVRDCAGQISRGRLRDLARRTIAAPEHGE